MNSPFIYSNDNKRYHTYNYYTRQKYGSKVYKVCIDAGFSCPNRDGTVGYGGCNFCSERGSGDMIPDTENIELQIQGGFEIMNRKWNGAQAIAYFQSYSNTHAPLHALKKLYTPYFFDDRFISIDIATRSDCLDQEKIAFFKSMSVHKEVTFEIGLQSIHHQTGLWMNRGHDLNSVVECVNALKEANIPVCLHIINGFPNESVEMMLETARFCASLKPEMIKIHMLHVIKDTPLGQSYLQEPFDIIDQETYVDLVIAQLELLPPETVIARLTGDGVLDDVLAPLWTLKKVSVLNDIDKEMARRNTVQGRLYKPTSI
ncbi:radical SAM protein [Erysipelothrix larvae]|uniref:Radical SAM protein n=1 Tax=Erysipelothrix larvae TaxID=1514105 RepID=A0A109UGS5_9FIRM|nr:TIGR01212 family radical SAM protein [Erysipelothrix larvae]AMC93043.1 radical SAM protein [Erysipelothrix larvae]